MKQNTVFSIIIVLLLLAIVYLAGVLQRQRWVVFAGEVIEKDAPASLFVDNGLCVKQFIVSPEAYASVRVGDWYVVQDGGACPPSGVVKSQNVG